jgi:hypothetical protein
LCRVFGFSPLVFTKSGGFIVRFCQRLISDLELGNHRSLYFSGLVFIGFYKFREKNDYLLTANKCGLNHKKTWFKPKKPMFFFDFSKKPKNLG